MTMKTKWLTMALAAVLPVLGAGCAAVVVGGAVAAAGVGTYAYVNGEMKGTEAVSLDRAWKASQATMADLEYPILKKTKDALQAELTARTAADKKILIKLKRVSNEVTEIRIRVGTFGDESMSQLILDKIKSHL
jgi:hypothetical protein